MQEAKAEFCQGNLLFFQQYQNPNEQERHNSSTNNNTYLSPNFEPLLDNQISIDLRASHCESSGKMSIENEPNENFTNNLNPRQLEYNKYEDQEDLNDGDNSEEHISLEKSFEKSPIFKKLTFVFNLDIVDDYYHKLPQNSIQLDQNKEDQQDNFTQQKLSLSSQYQNLLPQIDERSNNNDTFLDSKYNQQLMQSKIEEIVEQVFSSDQINVINNTNKSRSEENSFLFNQNQQENLNTFNCQIKTNICYQDQEQLEQHDDDVNYHNIYEKIKRKKIKNNNEQAAVLRHHHQVFDEKKISNKRYNSANKKEEKKQLIQNLQTQQTNQQINQICNELQQKNTFVNQSCLNNHPPLTSNNQQPTQSNLLNPTIQSNTSSSLFSNFNHLSDSKQEDQNIKQSSNKTSPNKLYDPYNFLQKSLEINQTLQQNLNQLHSIDTLNQKTFDSLKEKVAQNNTSFQPQFLFQNNFNNYQTKDLFEPYIKMCNFYEPNDQIDQSNMFISHHEYNDIQDKPTSSKQRTNFLSEKNSDEQDQENFSDVESVSSNPNNTKSYISSQDDIDDLLRLDEIDLNDFSDVYCKYQNNSQNTNECNKQNNISTQ